MDASCDILQKAVQQRTGRRTGARWLNDAFGAEKSLLLMSSCSRTLLEEDSVFRAALHSRDLMKAMPVGLPELAAIALDTDWAVAEPLVGWNTAVQHPQASSERDPISIGHLIT